MRFHFSYIAATFAFLALSSFAYGRETEDFTVTHHAHCLVDAVRARLDGQTTEILEIPLNDVSSSLPKILEPADLHTGGKLVSAVLRLRQRPLRSIGRLIRNGETTETTASDVGFLTPGQKYNYVITGDQIAIAKTGKNPTANVLSKHFMLAGEHHDVRYAGEMWVDTQGRAPTSTITPEAFVPMALTSTRSPKFCKPT